MTAALLVLAPDDDARLAATAAHHGHTVLARCGSAAEAAVAVDGSGADLVIATSDPRRLDAGLVAACDAAGVRIVAVGGDGRVARSLGLLDILDGPAEWPAIVPPRGTGAVPAGHSPVDEHQAGERRIGEHAADEYAAGGRPSGARTAGDPSVVRPPAIPPVAPRRGRVVVVWGPAGAPGRTSLAIAIAAELAAVGDAVVLADADTHAAAIAPSLGLLDEAPGFAAACRLAGTDALDPSELDRLAAVCRTRSGAFRVLTGLGRPSRWPELSADRVETTLRVARSWADWTVVDVAAPLEQDEELSSDLMAPRRNAAAVTALRAADAVIAVGSADPIGLSRYLRGHAELLDLVDPERVSVVVNRVRASAIGLDPAGQVRQTLLRFGGIDDPLLVPSDPGAFDAALLSGRPLSDVAPHSPARAAIRDLVAARLLPPEPDGRLARRRERAPRRPRRSIRAAVAGG